MSTTELDTSLIVREDEFLTYVKWKSLPPFFRNPPRDKKTKEIPTTEDFLMNLGIDDPTILDLASIRTQKEFAERYNVTENTLCNWNTKIKERDLLSDIRDWAMHLTKNVTMSLYMQTIKGGLPQHYALWYQVMSEWNPKIDVNNTTKHVTLLEIEVVKPKTLENADTTGTA